ncbi:MAG: fibronectin type III domain-containing protein, partial [Nocardioides sp.]
DVPDAPSPPLPGNSVVSQQVSLTWGEPEANGAPIDYYEVRASGGPTKRCAATACEVTGLTNGRTYTFQVRAHNAVGFSDWSGSSRGATPDEKPGLVGTIRNTRVADRTLVIAWSPPANATSDISYYVVTYGGTSRKTFRPEATVTGLDNNLKYSFKVYAVNDVGRGPVRTSRTMQSQGPVGIPAAPTIEDTATSSSTASLTISWPPVPPNGPGPVNYRVLRDGAPVPGCDTLQTVCYLPNVSYDGSLNSFRVGASVGRELPNFGPAKDWYAVGRPDPWGPWTVEPTGKDGEARVSFTVPEARGTASTVAIIADGNVAREYDARGAQSQLVAVGTNAGPHNVALRVCNEYGRCSETAPQQVQPYGPLNSSHILAIRAEQSATAVRWIVTANANGKAAQVKVESAYRSVVLPLGGIGTQDVVTDFVELGFATTEVVTVTIYDVDPSRGSGTAQQTYTVPPPTPATVSIYKGDPCIDLDDGSGKPPCTPDGDPKNDCIFASCGFIKLATTNFPDGATCEIDSSIGKIGGTGAMPRNGEVQTTYSFGQSGQTVDVSCFVGPLFGTFAEATYTWPP